MKKFYAILILTIAVLQYCETYAQDEDIVTPKEKEENLKVDTRIDNMGYWIKKAEEGHIPYTQPIPVKPAKYKGSILTGKGLKAVDSPDVAVTSATNVTESENSVFIDPNDNQYILNSNNSTSWNGSTVGTLYGANYFQTANGGVSWGGSASGAGGSNSGDPTTAINHSGRQFVNYISNSYGQGVSYSDNGSTWIPVTIAPNPGSLADKNHMWIDNSLSSTYVGNLYTAWTPFGGSDDAEIVISRSADNGESWSSPPLNISSAVSAGSHNQGVNIQTGPNGDVYVVWTIYDSWPSDETALGFAKSTNGGSSYGAATRIISNIKGIRTSETTKNHRVNSFPVMATDISSGPNSGNLYIVWSNIGTPGVNTGSNISVYMIRSTNGGSTWSSPIRVNQGPSSNGFEAYFPWITCDPETGVIAVVYYDDRDIATHPTVETETWVAYSFDAGNTWTDMRVSDVQFTPSAIPGLAGGYMGDYLGITSKGGRFYPCWTDTRGGLYMTYVSPFELGLNAEFSADITNVCAGGTVTFTDASTGPPTSWNWSFPGGTPSSATGAGPHTITYNTPGTYNVSLTVGDGSSTDTETKTSYITVENIIADFSGSPTTVVVGNTVTFTDNSACNPISWSWSFPGGTPSTASGIGPHTITYYTVGTYNASLTVSNASYNDTETKVAYIDVINCNYCAASGGGDEYISGVQLGSINNTGTPSSGYYDYTSLSTNLTLSQTYSITVTNGTVYST
ncbi:MAG: PKD domain-containing protein, partial [Bacteroidales bacterium]|nr:PKD domain-containing protein [Bacteroidales bacterium]